jgi:PKD repeat protein
MYGGVQDAQGYEVFKSIDGGTNWINWSTPTLDNINATNIEHQRGSDGGVYLGTRDAVYYRNNSMSDWSIFDNNLPKSTTSTQLIPYYREGKLFNGTNRSAYKIDFYENSPPSAQIAANKLTINCLNDTVQFVDHSAVRHSSATWQWSFPGGTPSSSTQEDPIVVYSQPGTYDVSLTVTDAFGSSTQNYTNFIEYTDSIYLITNTNELYQGFDSDIFPPDAWEIPITSFSWQSIEVDTGINCQPNKVAYVNHYWIDQKGKEAYLVSNKIKLGGGATAQNWLTYDYAYSGYANGYNDGLRIDISTDCGATWDSIYGAIGPDLQTTAYVGSAWYPTCGSWDTDSVNLSDWGLNGDTIMIRFVAINDYGNRFFMDNIKINGQNILSINNLEKTNKIEVFPNPSNGKFSVKSNLKNIEFEIYSTVGKLIDKGIINRKSKLIDISNQKKGIYFLQFKIEEKIIQSKLIVQ